MNLPIKRRRPASLPTLCGLDRVGEGAGMGLLDRSFAPDQADFHGAEVPVHRMFPEGRRANAPKPTDNQADAEPHLDVTPNDRGIDCLHLARLYIESG